MKAWRKTCQFVFLMILAIVTGATQLIANQGQVPYFRSYYLGTNGNARFSGMAAPKSSVELINGARLLGKALAQANGDFIIEVQQKLAPGNYHVVLRATQSDGRSTTSLQTANIIVPDKRTEDTLVFVEEPGRAKHLISKASANVTPHEEGESLLSVDFVVYDKKSLIVFGHGPAHMHVLASVYDKRAGTVTINNDRSFVLIRPMVVLPGDQVVRVDLFDENGTRRASINLPFHVASIAGTSRQAYLHGKPVRSIVVKRGDTLSMLAKRFYGSASYAEYIFAVNKERLSRINYITPGQTILLPPIKKQE